MKYDELRDSSFDFLQVGEDDINEYEKSGIILIDGSTEYSAFPYSQTNFIQDDPTWGLIETKYNEVNSNSKLLNWVKKDSKLNIEVYIHNSRHIWVAVDKTTTSQTNPMLQINLEDGVFIVISYNLYMVKNLK